MFTEEYFSKWFDIIPESENIYDEIENEIYMNMWKRK